MQFTAAQIALMINGKVEGNPAAAVAAFGKIEEATAGQLAFLSNPKYEEWLYNSSASIIIVNDAYGYSPGPYPAHSLDPGYLNFEPDLYL